MDPQAERKWGGGRGKRGRRGIGERREGEVLQETEDGRVESRRWDGEESSERGRSGKTE